MTGVSLSSAMRMTYIDFCTVYEIRTKMYKHLCKLLFKFKVILGTFSHVIKYTLQHDF